MRSLFSDFDHAPAVPAIAGFLYLPEFVTAQDEARLVAAIDKEPWDTTWERRRQLYGGSYGRGAETVAPIPSWAQSLIDRLQRTGVGDRPFDHVLVNEYLPGQGIALHVDYEPFDHTVASLSLLSPCVMDFRRVSDGHREAMLLDRRSLLVLSDEARYEWQHGIARRKNDRWQGQVLPRTRRLSVTFRQRKR
jgi:alkylated DNA repair dioxygenase AlkB